MMDDRVDNFGAVQYPVNYSKLISDDEFLNVIGEMNNAAPLIQIIFMRNEKNALPLWAQESNNATAAAETWGLTGHILRSGRMRSWIL